MNSDTFNSMVGVEMGQWQVPFSQLIFGKKFASGGSGQIFKGKYWYCSHLSHLNIAAAIIVVCTGLLSFPLLS